MLEGIIKYQQKFTLKDNLTWNDVHDLENCRKKLRPYNLIGEDPIEHLGHGNLSGRWMQSNSFIITGTQTGKLSDLNPSHYTKVVNFDLASQLVEVEGPIPASSEALTHGALYLQSPEIKFVIHIHHRQMWEKMLQGNFKRTDSDIEYGSLAMAEAMAQLVSRPEDVLVMAGHQDGIIFFGPQLDPLASKIIDFYQQMKL